VGMLQEADIGVGISGVEGMQVLWKLTQYSCFLFIHFYFYMLYSKQSYSFFSS
jgi:hypothetical protein